MPVAMKGKPKKSPREKDITSRYMSGGYDEDRAESGEKFSSRSKHAVQNKLEKTTAMRAGEESVPGDVNSLPVGEVVQVYSLFSEVEGEARPSPLPSPGVPGEGAKEDGSAGASPSREEEGAPGEGDASVGRASGPAKKVTYLCVVRKTLAKASETGIVVGDRVRFRVTGATDDQGRPEAVIEQLLPRKTILTRAESFKGTNQHPIVANADQMLIVASLLFPAVKWGLVDRMIVAAQSGGLVPIVCLNKVDLAAVDGEGAEAAALASEVLLHYQGLGIRTLRTSVEAKSGLDDLIEILGNKVTVLAGHSGVGKSSLIRSIQPELDIRIGRVSAYTSKGIHTTTSAKRYLLSFGGAVVDTPGIKTFGLWGVSRENVKDFFPDVVEGRAPEWRRQSMARIEHSVAEGN
jgi:ribosome small subunit-dependent GTPase A